MWVYDVNHRHPAHTVRAGHLTGVKEDVHVMRRTTVAGGAPPTHGRGEDISPSRALDRESEHPHRRGEEHESPERRASGAALGGPEPRWT